MKYKIDHDYHIHSKLSACSQVPEQTKERIFQYAKDNGLRQICITDHYWDSEVDGASRWYAPQNFEHISQIKPLPSDERVRFAFGCETDMDKFGVIGIPQSRFNDFDFMIVPTTHLHMKGWTIEEAECESNALLAKAWVRRFDDLLNSDLPFKKVGIAHLACPLINKKSRADYLKTLDLLPQNDLERLFSKAAELGCGIELNQEDMKFSEEEKDTILRIFRTAKYCGCKFYLGSDAHEPGAFTHSIALFAKAIDELGLTEQDKFIL